MRYGPTDLIQWDIYLAQVINNCCLMASNHDTNQRRRIMKWNLRNKIRHLMIKFWSKFSVKWINVIIFGAKFRPFVLPSDVKFWFHCHAMKEPSTDSLMFCLIITAFMILEGWICISNSWKLQQFTWLSFIKKINHLNSIRLSRQKWNFRGMDSSLWWETMIKITYLFLNFNGETVEV